ncbi:four helix bundle protein [Nostoc sp. 'Peltigera membranacea cyanobiont' 232]|uniref:four helix bundle protein n=1 Tax=Nostoc sp. 'Peltigera membranacea cyanobiont' 232 TaxID=2014531 RepID=UPI000B95590F|nr:four helix bundle protein [Nostoc sp. 'Peltigera membranacea cyanobiont' 232]OYE03821.1 four helix bundle protein [Nostoc sp. 'Peltigera membranacea cyanobiont' 232]
MNKEAIKDHKDLGIYKIAFEAAMKIFELSKKFPVEERYSLTDQIRRSDARRLATASLSRSVCANMAEAWRKRRYEAAFIAKLNDCVRGACRRQVEAAETQTWIEFAVKCNYINVELGREIYANYNQVLSGLVNMINNPSPWLRNH